MVSRTLKRVVDILVAAVGLIVFAPVIGIVAVAIRLTMGSPVFFRQTRPGLNATPFPLCKFRTMREATGPDGQPLPDAARLTWLGQFLRRSSLDELPQLWNVLVGDLSLVGPRPLLMRYLSRYNAEQARRHDVKPGITGWAQVNGRNAIGWDEKFRYDVWYVDHCSLGLDLKILALTALKVVQRSGISNEGHATMPEFMGDPMKQIYLSPPHMGPDELSLLNEAFTSNWIAPLGPHVEAFEREFAERVGVPYAVALSSGTAAIHLALRILGLRPGEEVLCSTLTFIASASPITYEGGQPVFIDSELRSCNMDPELLSDELEECAARGRLPRAVIVVDLYGQTADYERILACCERYGVPLISDAAESLGATSRGQPAGSFGVCGVFSFNGNKIITTSGGGMLVSHDKEFVERARFLATQARDPAPHYEHSVVGFNYRLSNLLAAVGRGQLRCLDERVAQRRRNYEYYCAALAGLPGLALIPHGEWGTPNYWLTCVTIDPETFGATREDFRLVLEAEKIESRPVWKPLHTQPAFRGCRVRGGAVAERLFERGLCLPSGSSLTEADLQRVVSIVKSRTRTRAAV